MNRAKSAGTEGERIALWVLLREGWQIIGRQVDVYGHKVDYTMTHPVTGEEWLIEIKVWESARSGEDTVKKAIAVAYDLQQLGESRPYMLLISKQLGPLHADMLRRARRAGAMSDVRVIGTTEHYGEGIG